MATRTHGERNGASIGSHLRAILLVASMGATATFAPLANAQDWEFEPYVQLVATYTDNLYLLPEGFEIADYVGQVVPGFSLVRDQGRFTTNTEYRAQALYFSDSSDLNTVFHQLRSEATLALMTDRLFVDADASIEQAVVDPTRAIPTSNVAATANLGDVTFANVNPYFIQSLGSSDTYLRLDYLRGIGRYDGFGLETFSRVDDFDQDIAGVYIGTSELETGFEWSLSYDYQFMDYENVGDYNFERAQAAIGIPLSRRFRLVAMGGRESDLLIARDVGGLDSDFWEVGFRLNPGATSELEFRTGERFFGESYFGSFTLEGRRLGISLTYAENPTTSALGMLGALILPFNPDLNDQSSAPIDDIIVAPIRAEVYVSKMATARIDYETSRGGWYLTLVDEDREFLEEAETLEGSQDGQSAINLGYTHRLGPRTALEFVARRFRYDFALTPVHTNIFSYEAGISRQVGNSLEVGLNARYSKQESNSATRIDNYQETAVDLRLMKSF